MKRSRILPIFREYITKAILGVLLFTFSFASTQIITQADLSPDLTPRNGHMGGGTFISWVNSILLNPSISSDRITNPYNSIENPTVRSSAHITDRELQSTISKSLAKKIVFGDVTQYENSQNIDLINTLEIYNNTPQIGIYTSSGNEKNAQLTFRKKEGNNNATIKYEHNSGTLQLGVNQAYIANFSQSKGALFTHLKVNNKNLIKGNQYCYNAQNEIDPTQFIKSISSEGGINCEYITF